MAEGISNRGQEFTAGATPIGGAEGQRQPDVVVSRLSEATTVPNEVAPVAAPGKLPRQAPLISVRAPRFAVQDIGAVVRRETDDSAGDASDAEQPQDPSSPITFGEVRAFGQAAPLLGRSGSGKSSQIKAVFADIARPREIPMINAIGRRGGGRAVYFNPKQIPENGINDTIVGAGEPDVETKEPLRAEPVKPQDERLEQREKLKGFARDGKGAGKELVELQPEQEVIGVKGFGRSDLIMRDEVQRFRPEPDVDVNGVATAEQLAGLDAAVSYPSNASIFKELAERYTEEFSAATSLAEQNKATQRYLDLVLGRKKTDIADTASVFAADKEAFRRNLKNYLGAKDLEEIKRQLNNDGNDSVGSTDRVTIPALAESPLVPEPAPLRLPNGKLTNAEAKRIVAENSDVADVSEERNRFFASPSFLEAIGDSGLRPLDLILAQRSTALQTPELQKFLKKAYAQERVQDAMSDLERNDDLAVDPRFSLRSDPLMAVLAEVFKDKDGLLPELMQAIDARVASSAEANIAAIENAKMDGEIIKKDVVLVGGGPITALVASILAPFRNVTIITKNEKAGGDWLYRNLWGNSSGEVKDPLAARLPLQDGTTTPISPAQSQNFVDTRLLEGTEYLEIPCADGSIRKYWAGKNFGRLIALAEGLTDADFIVGHDVAPAATKKLDDGTQRITFVDTLDGTERVLDANAVFFINGPGKEVARFEDKASKELFEQVRIDFDEQIRTKRQQIVTLREELGMLILQSPSEERNQLIQEKEAELNGITLVLPRILSQGIQAKAYEFWETYLVDEDGKPDPKKWPFAPLFKKDVRIGKVGNGDQGRTDNEFLNGLAPSDAYPEGFDPTDPENMPETFWYNIPQETPDEYRAVNRQRYRDVFTDRTISTPERADKIFIENDNGERVVAVDGSKSSNGLYVTSYFNYVFVATGLESERIENKIPFFDTYRAFDYSSTNITGLENIDKTIAILGAAADLARFGYSAKINKILDALGVSENTKSLWLNAILAEKYVWRWLAEKGVNKEKIQAVRDARAA